VDAALYLAAFPSSRPGPGRNARDDVYGSMYDLSGHVRDATAGAPDVPAGQNTRQVVTAR
jgi:hypothetical protein